MTATNVAELARADGNNDELHLPIGTQFGSANRISAAEFRKRLEAAETGLNGNPPPPVLANSTTDSGISLGDEAAFGQM